MIDYFPKLIQLDEVTKTSEPTIQLVRPRDWAVPHVKVAAESLDYIRHVKPIPNETTILVLAMSAGEYYGPNRNGDGWPERPLRVGQTEIGPDEVLPQRYKTFETHANVFKHHINKDPNKRIGRVLRAFYNWQMHRVELLLSLLNQEAEDVVQHIEKGEFPAVSMGCFTAGNLVTMADGTRKPIEEVSVGDRVLTHKGNAKRVTEVHKRPYNGSLYRIKLPVYPEIECTEEHPFWATDKGYHRWDHGATPSCDWVHAKCLDDHLLFEPVRTEVRMPDYVTRAFARLFGYYLAEGHVVFGCKNTPILVSLSVNRTDPILDEIDDLCRSFGTRNKPNIYPKPNSDEALTIDISDAELASLCLEHGGRYGRHKRLSESALLWDPGMQREMLGAYANGDGHGLKTGALSLSTASPDLAWQLVAIGHRLGLLASIQNLVHKAGSGFSKRNTYEWVVCFEKQWAQQLKTVCSKVVNAEIQVKRNDRVLFENQIAAPICSIVEERTSADVYNLEVEDDESYVVNGASVHNCKIKYDVCSICGHKAPSREHYCSHAKFQLTRFLPNGKQVFVWNPMATFFDISMVRRPADRIGFMMKKVAESIPEIWSSAEMGEYVDCMSRKLADARKLSVMDKIIQGGVAASKEEDGDLNVIKNFADQVAQPAAIATPPLDDSVIQEMLQHRPADVLSTLSSMGIFLTTPEFLKYFVWQLVPNAEIPDGVLERATDVQQQVFDILSQNPDLIEEVENSGFLNLSPENIRPELVNKFTPLLEKRSQHHPYLQRRLVASVLQKNAAETLEPGQGHWDLFEVADPVTGRRYRTTRSAIMGAREQASKMRNAQTLRNIFGGGALLSGAYKLLGHKLPPRDPYVQAGYARPFAAHTGEMVPGMTEVKSAALHIAHENAIRRKGASAPLILQNTKHAALLLSEANFDSVAQWLGKVICP